MAHLPKDGAIAPTLLPFPRRESRDPTDLPELLKLIGRVYDLDNGLQCTVVIAEAQILKPAVPLNDLNYALGYSSVANQLSKTARITTGAGQVIAGFTFADMHQVEAGELHWMVLPTAGVGRLAINAHAAIAASDFLGSQAAGRLVSIAQSTVPGVTPLQALEAAAAQDDPVTSVTVGNVVS